jgi:hypothetical protein
MNKIKQLLVLIGLAAVTASAQLTISTTTLSAAVSGLPGNPGACTGNALISLASSSGISGPQPGQPAPYVLYVDRELMRVQSVSGNNVLVTRGYDGTNCAPHISGRTVMFGRAFQFSKNTPPIGGGCTLPMASTPIVNVFNGDVVVCGLIGGSTTVSAYTSLNANGPMITGADIASATTLATTPYAAIHHVTGTTAIATIPVPLSCVSGCRLILIPDALFTFTTAGNISVASTAVVGKAYEMIYDPKTAKWQPSY